MKSSFIFLLIVFIISGNLPRGLSAYPEEAVAALNDRCRDCKLFFTNHEDLQGRLISLNNQSLELEFYEKVPNEPFQVRKFQKTFPLDEIVLMQCGDPTYNGAVWGFVIGGLATAFFTGVAYSIDRVPGREYDTSPGKMAALGLLIGGGVGATVGYFIDAASGYRIETKGIHEWLGESER